MKATQKEKERIFNLDPESKERAEALGLTTDYPVIQNRDELTRQLRLKAKYIGSEKAHKVREMMGLTNNHFAFHMAIREKNIRDLVAEVLRLREQLAERSLWRRFIRAVTPWGRR